MSLVLENSENFKFIIRLLNTNVNGARKVVYGLSQIKGVGRRFSRAICRIARIDPMKRAGELSEKDLQQITNIIANPVDNGIPVWFLNRKRDFKDGSNLQVTSNQLETKLREDIERLKKLRSHRGIRHHWNLKVRGQHTKSNGRGGTSVGVSRKK